MQTTCRLAVSLNLLFHAAGLAVLCPPCIQLLGASPTCAILPYLGQLCVCFHDLHICLGCFPAVGSNICEGSLGQIHHCVLLWSSPERCLSGPCGFQVCSALRLLIADCCFCKFCQQHMVLPLPFNIGEAYFTLADAKAVMSSTSMRSLTKFGDAGSSSFGFSPTEWVAGPLN